MEATHIVIPHQESYSAFSGPPRSLHHLLWAFQEQEALENPDITLDLANLNVSDHGNVVIPDLGEYQLTPWAQKQLAGLVGVKWDRWFMNASPADQAEELNRRFQRYSVSFRQNC